jgi:hypothetical protein
LHNVMPVTPVAGNPVFSQWMTHNNLLDIKVKHEEVQRWTVTHITPDIDRPNVFHLHFLSASPGIRNHT